VPKPLQALAGKVLQEAKQDGNQNVNQNPQQVGNVLQEKTERSIPAGPDSRIALLPGERFRVNLETSACFK